MRDCYNNGDFQRLLRLATEQWLLSQLKREKLDGNVKSHSINAQFKKDEKIP